MYVNHFTLILSNRQTLPARLSQDKDNKTKRPPQGLATTQHRPSHLITLHSAVLSVSPLAVAIGRNDIALSSYLPRPFRPPSGSFLTPALEDVGTRGEFDSGGSIGVPVCFFPQGSPLSLFTRLQPCPRTVTCICKFIPPVRRCAGALASHVHVQPSRACCRCKRRGS